MNIQAWAGQLVCLFVYPMHSKCLLFLTTILCDVNAKIIARKCVPVY